LPWDEGEWGVPSVVANKDEIWFLCQEEGNKFEIRPLGPVQQEKNTSALDREEISGFR